jgi:16S rRNA G1207 methylase RsmC
LGLFKEVKRCLKTGGRFQLVASQHLNFKTHLVKLFKEVNITAENDKFVIYECIKG